VDKVAKSIESITDYESFYELRRILENQANYIEEWKFADYVVRHIQDVGYLPTPEALTDYFDIGEVVAPKEPDKYLRNLVINYRDKVLRQRMLEINSKELISASDIQELSEYAAPISSGVELVSTANFEGKVEYDVIKSRPVGMKFFLTQLDVEVSGIAYGSMLTIFGYVGAMKTTMLLSLIYSNAKDLGYNTVVITLEVPKRELYFNLLSRHAYEMDPGTEITAKKIKKAMLNDEEEDFLWNKVEPDFKSMEGNIFILDGTDITDSSGRITETSFAAQIERIHTQYGVDCISLDYVQLISNFGFSKGSQAANEFIAFFFQYLIAFDNKRGLIGILLSQANREGWSIAPAWEPPR